MIKLAIMVLSVGSLGLIGYQFFPDFVERLQQFQEKRTDKSAQRIEKMFVKPKATNLFLLYTALPIVLATVGYMLINNLAGILGGAVLGLLAPSIIIKNTEMRRREKFRSQIIDAIMLISSSLKAGLSLVQSLEVLVEDMPEPINQEFGMLLNEHKMGAALEEAFEHLVERMPSTELKMIKTAIILSKQTGGNLPEILGRLSGTIRDKNKIQENVKTLTMQGRIQGVVMSILPVGFTIVVYKMQPGFFDTMLSSDIGKTLLIVAVALEIIGIILIRKISRVNV